MQRTFFIAGSVSGFAGVALGAFAAHELRGTIDAEMFGAFTTGVRYELYHAFALLAAALAAQWIGRYATTAGWCFLFGSILFCGSLYTLALTGLRWLGAITPFGGLLFLAGWAALAIGAARMKRSVP